MTSYDTTYNRDLARSQRLYDYANIKNDTLQYNAGPTHQGGGMSGGNSCGMGRPFSDVAQGMGYSGGVRRGAELADVASASGQFSVVPGRSKATGSGLSGGGMSGGDIDSGYNMFDAMKQSLGFGQSGGKRPKLVKGSAEAKAYMASIRKKKGQGAGVYGMPELLGRTTQVLEGKGGTDGFPSGFKDNNPNAMAGGRRRGRGMSGGAVPLKQQLVGILDDRTLNGSGMSGGDFWSDFGDGFMSVMKPVGQVVSAIAPFLGAGQSGGNAGVSSELALMSGSAPLAEAFLGGRRPADVPRDEKVMLMKKALADYAMMKQLKNHLKARQGGGMSGGDYGLANSSVGMGMSGGGMSGGELSHDGNMAMADAMGDIFAGMGTSGGRAVGGSHRLQLPQEKYGTSMTGSGIMEPAVSAEVGQPRYSYGNMADTAGKSNVGSGGGASGGRRRRGKGMSGGDFWSDLGSTALQLAPLLALL